MWDEVETWRKRAAFSRMIEISRKEFENGEFISKDELVDSIEKEIDSGFAS